LTLATLTIVPSATADWQPFRELYHIRMWRSMVRRSILRLLLFIGWFLLGGRLILVLLLLSLLVVTGLEGIVETSNGSTVLSEGICPSECLPGLEVRHLVVLIERLFVDVLLEQVKRILRLLVLADHELDRSLLLGQRFLLVLLDDLQKFVATVGLDGELGVQGMARAHGLLLPSLVRAEIKVRNGSAVLRPWVGLGEIVPWLEVRHLRVLLEGILIDVLFVEIEGVLLVLVLPDHESDDAFLVLQGEPLVILDDGNELLATVSFDGEDSVHRVWLGGRHEASSGNKGAGGGNFGGGAAGSKRECRWYHHRLEVPEVLLAAAALRRAAAATCKLGPWRMAMAAHCGAFLMFT
jgi:hypothetical protein